jgi:hypothetical protein
MTDKSMRTINGWRTTFIRRIEDHVYIGIACGDIYEAVILAEELNLLLDAKSPITIDPT